MIYDYRTFLIRLAVEAFNVQRGFNFTVDEFDVFSIDNNETSDCAFQFYSTRFDDNLRLRLYCNFGTVNVVRPYVLEEDNDQSTILYDWLFVADAVLDSEYLHLTDKDIQQNLFIVEADPNRLGVLLMEDGEALLGEDGDYLLLEESF